MVSNIGGETQFDGESIGYAVLGGAMLGLSSVLLLWGFSKSFCSFLMTEIPI